jgi:haloalkane dehalogenase
VLTQQLDLFDRVVISNTGLPDVRGVPKGMAKPMRAMLHNVPALPTLDMMRKMAANEFDTGFMYWVKHCDAYPDLSISDIMMLSLSKNESCMRNIQAIRLAYDAPFPSEEYKQGAREFPSLVPMFPDDPAISANVKAWKVLATLQQPFLTCFTDSDPVTRGLEKRFQEVVPGAQSQKHVTIEKAGHFVQEEAPNDFSAAIVGFCKANPLP